MRSMGFGGRLGSRLAREVCPGRNSAEWAVEEIDEEQSSSKHCRVQQRP